MKIQPNAVHFESLKLFTLNNYEVKDNELAFEILKKVNEEENIGSYAEISCDGFVGYNIQANYNYDFNIENNKSDDCPVVVNTKLVQTNDVAVIAEQREAFLGGAACRPSLLKQFQLPFTIQGKDIKTFKAPFNLHQAIEPFVIKDYESVLFHPKEGYIYKSTRIENSEISSSESSVQKYKSKIYSGAHFKKVDLQLFGIANGESGENRAHFRFIDVPDFFANANGLTGRYVKKDMKEEIDIGGWPVQLTDFIFEVIDNAVGKNYNTKVINDQNIIDGGGAFIGGKMMLPVVNKKNEDNWMVFVGALGFDTNANSQMAFLRIEESELGKEFDLPMWGGFKMKIGTNTEAPTATITLHLNDDADDYWNKAEFEPFANMSGRFIVDFRGSKPKKDGFYEEDGFMPFLSIPALSFTGWKINDPSVVNRCKSGEGNWGGIRNMTFDAFGVGGAGSVGSVQDEASKDVQNQVFSGLQGRGLSIWDINFNCNSSDKAEGYKIDFELHVNLIGSATNQEEINDKQENSEVVEKKPARSRSNAMKNKGKVTQVKEQPKNRPRSEESVTKANVDEFKRKQEVKNNTTLGGSSKSIAERSKSQKKQKPKKISELKMIGQLQVHTGYLKSQFEDDSKSRSQVNDMRFLKVSPEAFLINAEFSAFDFNGGMVLINDDPKYGVGFKGYVDLKVGKDKGIGVKAVMQWGKTDYDDSTGQEAGDDSQFDYGFGDFEVFRENGWLIPGSKVVYFHGAGAGIQYNMITEDPSPETTFSSGKKKKAKNVGEVDHDSGILSEQADPFGYLTPGKSLSGFTFNPRPNTFGFGGKGIFSINNSALFAWGDLGINLSFTKDWVPLKANLKGNAYLLTPLDGGEIPKVGDPTGAAGLGTLDVELNLEKGYLIATSMLDLTYPADVGGSKDNNLGGSATTSANKGSKKLAKSENDIRTTTKFFDKKAFINTNGKFKLPTNIQTFAYHMFGEATFVYAWKTPSTTVDIPLKEAGEWHLKFGSPASGIGEEFKFLGISFAKMEGYLQAGHYLDEVPTIAQLIPEWNNDDAKIRRKESDMSKSKNGKGFIFGSRFKIPDNTYDFLMFSGRLAAGAGFDVSLLHYDEAFAKSAGCGKGDGKFGMNNWYVRGQAFAWFKAVLDMKIKLGFVNKKVNIFDAFAGAVMQAEFPNPTWFMAVIKARFSVLNGAISGNVNFKAEIGERCMNNVNPVASIPIIGDILPNHEDKKVPVFQNPAIAFNFPVDKPITISEYDDDGKENKRTFRAHLDEFIIKDAKGNRISGKMKYADDKYAAEYQLNELLQANQKYTLQATASWEEWDKGSKRWKTFEYNNKVYVEKTNPEAYTFETGGLPDKIYREMLAYQAPGYGQRFWHEGYAYPQLLFKQHGNDFLFPSNTTQLKKDYGQDADYKNLLKDIPNGINL
ncbi:MAG: hypothetical protein AAF705_03900, partial [Bacteroidota bacterium]